MLMHRSYRMPRIVVDVMPKPEILDPQGKAIVGALPRLGFTSFSSVRQGKRFELTVDGEVTEDILAQARDAPRAVRLAGGTRVALWHADTELGDVDAVVIPGGFSYGDYLRAGAIARFSPLMESVFEFAREGGPVLGICNGFQVLCEAGLLPGALLDNAGLKFVCRQVDVVVERTRCVFARGLAGERLSIPVKHTTGRYYAPDVDAL